MSRLRLVIGVVVALGLAGVAWFQRGSPGLAGYSPATGGAADSTTPDTAATLKAAGVHKCQGASGTSYVDGACPAHTREVAATGGTLTVTSFPRPAPPPGAQASPVLGGPLVKGMDADERDRLRDKAVDDAMNRR